METKCHAPIDSNSRREKHKVSLGIHDNNYIVSCVWCGKTLENFLQDKEKAIETYKIETVEQALDRE